MLDDFPPIQVGTRLKNPVSMPHTVSIILSVDMKVIEGLDIHATLLHLFFGHHADYIVV